MKNSVKKTLIIFFTVLGINLFLINSVFAVETFPVDELVVEFQNEPLFNEVNFVPENSVTRWIKITNNSGVAKKVAIEAINKTNLDNLASKINLVIKEGTNIRYEKTLAEFFSGGEIYLSDLPSGSQTQYDLTVSFNSDAGNNMQGKSLGFDILIGFQGGEGISGGGSGGS
ncbi:MAG: hypothetical protein Q8O66_01375, partial [bacterium]|nr:hypothetical protein [bacterium]